MNPSELILNSDGSIYHLHLLPEDIAPTVIFVGDQDRVPHVSQLFDRMDIKKHKREFTTHTGWIGDKRISVISTGIGTDNIDIVLNELDALVNIDFSNRKVKEKLTRLDIIRIGTSGSIHPDINCDEIVVSTIAVGMDSLGEFYPSKKINHSFLPPWSYAAERHPYDLHHFHLPFKEGITLTCPGFYGPQGRVLRIAPSSTIPFNELHKQKLNNFSFTNMEMETAGIYLLANVLGHQAISFNAILANRLNGNFSQHPEKIVHQLIHHTLLWIGEKHT